MDSNRPGQGPQDYFVAYLDNDELMMEPHCACGEMLEKDYFCWKCDRQCLCVEIRCRDEVAYDHVQRTITGAPGFKKFSVTRMKSG